MGQLISRILGSASTPPLLQLPVEILLSIAAQLSSFPESIVALSLTCKALFHVLERDRSSILDTCRDKLLVLLEKDLGNRFFYCSTCSQLHPFAQSWRPTSMEHMEHRNIKYNRLCCHRGQFFNPNPGRSPCNLYYVHARLVMNRYLYGAPNGISLENLTIPAVAHTWAGGPLWLQDLSAKIIDDELFLQVRHTLEGGAATVRAAIDNGEYSICLHVATDPISFESLLRSVLARIPELQQPKVENKAWKRIGRPFGVAATCPGRAACA